MPPVIVVHDDSEHPLFTVPDALYNRIQAAAEWCQQTEYEFIKAGILDRLDDVETVMLGWDEGEEP